MTFIGDIPNLQKLWLTSVNVSNTAITLNQLLQFPATIMHLNIMFCSKISNNVLKAFGSTASVELQTLEFRLDDNFDLTNVDFLQEKAFNNIIEIHANGVSFKNNHLSSMTSCLKKLKRAILSETNINNDGLESGIAQSESIFEVVLVRMLKITSISIVRILRRVLPLQYVVVVGCEKVCIYCFL